MASEVKCLRQAGQAMGRAAEAVFSPKFSFLKSRKGSATFKSASSAQYPSSNQDPQTHQEGYANSVRNSHEYHSSLTSEPRESQLPIRFLCTQISPSRSLYEDESKRRTLNRILYRSKQRGFLELDLLLGGWAEKNISSLDENGLLSIVSLLDVENPDLWKWLTGQEQPPESIQSNPVFVALKTQISSRLDLYSQPETRASPGLPWVRGWDDKQKPSSDQIPPFGNQ